MADLTPQPLADTSDVPTPTGRSRSRGVGLDMIRSMGLVALVLLGWMYFAHPRTPEGIHTVPWYPTAQAAAETAEYEVLAPAESFAWPATSARVEPAPDGTFGWRVGFYTPDELYAALIQRGVFPAQATGSVEQWIAEETRNGVPEGTVRIGGREWTRMTGDPTPDERRSLVLTDAGTVTIVTGSAPWAELEALATALQPVADEVSPTPTPVG